MPHRQLLLGIITEWPPAGGIPSPNLVRIQQVQFSLQLAARELQQVAFKIPINVIGMFFVFYKRAIGKDLSDPDLPKLMHKHAEICDQVASPGSIPIRIAV